jgi:hypothetical protein
MAHPTRKFTLCGTGPKGLLSEKGTLRSATLDKAPCGSLPQNNRSLGISPALRDRTRCNYRPINFRETVRRRVLTVGNINSDPTKFGIIDQKIGAILDNSRITPITDFKL